MSKGVSLFPTEKGMLSSEQCSLCQGEACRNWFRYQSASASGDSVNPLTAGLPAWRTEFNEDFPNSKQPSGISAFSVVAAPGAFEAEHCEWPSVTAPASAD